MNIASIDVFVLGLPFKSVFVLAGGIAGEPGALSHRVLVKLTTDSGVTGWGELTESAGLELAMSGLTETDLGLAAGLHLDSVFDINPLALNGPQYIDTPFVTQRVWNGGGQVHLPEGPGLGVAIDEDHVRHHALERYRE